MITHLRNALAVLLALTAALNAQNLCQSAKDAVGGTEIDLAPLAGYVEVCAQDTALCHTLTDGFPPSVTTLGYFVTSDGWRAYRQAAQGFDQYLIAQLARSMSAGDIPGFKRYVHAQQGSIPDHTRLPAVLESEGRVALGIFDETDSSISFGTVMKVRSRTDPRVGQRALVATNSMAVIKGRVLSLYIYRAFGTPADVDTTEQLTKRWLTCLRRAN